MSYTIPGYKEMANFGSIFHGTSQDIFHGYNVNFMYMKCEYISLGLACRYNYKEIYHLLWN